MSLCRTGRNEVSDGVEHARFWLVDQAAEDSNTNLDFVLGEAVDSVMTFRAEGKRVYVHCVGGRSRTAIVAALYLARRDEMPIADALRRVKAVLPDVQLNTRFADLLR